MLAVRFGAARTSQAATALEVDAGLLFLGKLTLRADMRYPAHFEPAPNGGYVVTFRDIPEALTQGEDEAHALEMAADALVTAMSFYFEGRRQVSMPSAAVEGERLVDLPPSIAAKVLLLNAMLETGVSNAELARRMGTRPQEVTRIVNLEHPTKIDTIAAALRVLGKRLAISIVGP